MILKRSTMIGILSAFIISTACSATQEPKQSSDPSSQEKSSEFIEIKISMPDGRVIIRKERKDASRVNANTLAHRKRIASKSAIKNKSRSKVNTLDQAITGGSNGSGSGLPKAGSSGGSSGSSSSNASGGGGGGASSNRSNGSGSGNSGDSNSPMIPIIQPDNDYTVRMYAWENSGPIFQYATKTYIADPRGKSPRQLAQRIAINIDRDQPEKIVIRFWKEFDPAIRDPFDVTNPSELIISGGFTQGLTEYWDQFASELLRLGVQPDYLVSDMESGIGFWNIPKDERYEFFSRIMSPASQLSETLPASMRNVTVDQLMNYRDQQGTIALNDYNQFAANFRASFINRVFEGAFQSAFNRYIPISNFADIYTSFEVRNYTNRPLPDASAGGISAPVAYIDLRNEPSPRYARLNKNQRWNRLIDLLNRTRSSASVGWVTPWISSPGYGRYGADTWARPNELAAENQIWSMMMDHMLAMGIDTFILWNPGPRFNPNARVTDGFIDQWIGLHPRAAGPQLQNLPEIPLDADSITTNGVTTTYQQFMTAMDGVE